MFCTLDGEKYKFEQPTDYLAFSPWVLDISVSKFRLENQLFSLEVYVVPLLLNNQSLNQSLNPPYLFVDSSCREERFHCRQFLFAICSIYVYFYNLSFITNLTSPRHIHQHENIPPNLLRSEVFVVWFVITRFIILCVFLEVLLWFINISNHGSRLSTSCNSFI
jgi:hypothetical protein